MNNKFIYSILIGLLFFSCNGQKDITVIKNVNLFDGDNYLEHVNVIFQKDGIRDITSESHFPAGADIIDGTGKTIIPPLLNAHVHTWMPASLKEALHSGVFALLDMHNTDDVANSLRGFRDSTGYAYYYSSGPGATVPGGHGTEYGIEVPTINDSVSPKQFVDDRINKHADYIKILREPRMKTISFSQTGEVIRVTHDHGKLCVAHISNLSDAMELDKELIDGFAHIWFDKASSGPQLDSLFKSGVFIVPTLYVTKKFLESKRSLQGDNLSFQEVMGEVKKCYQRGIPILAGTDAPNFKFNYSSDLFEEMKLLAQAGLTNTDVLKAATSNIYKAFKLKEFKKLQQGSNASFILINGNPVNNMDDIDKIEGVWQRGNRIR